MDDLMKTTMLLIESEQRNVALEKKLMILGRLRTNLSPNKRNELLREYNTINQLKQIT